MKKIKFLILALLGITIIPTATNAFELSKVNYIKKTIASSNFWFFEKACLRPILGSIPSWILRDGGYNERVLFNQITCREGYTLGNYYADESHGGSNSDKVYMRMYRYSMIAISQNGEGLDFWRTSLSNNTQSLHKFSIPSRTAYQYTTVGGQKFMLSQVYFYHNQFMFYDPTTRFSVSFLGKMKIENGMLLVNPDAITDNLWFINFQKQKAWSMTTTKTGALKWLLGVDISKDRLESLQFDKSYTMEEGGSRFLPTQFSPNSQGETVGWLYNEDTEFISPDFNTKKQETNSAEAYNQCSSYWSDVKNLAYYSQKCGDDPADEQTQNRVKVDSWNAEGNLPEFSEGANKNKCGRFANAKKKYKEKYKENWEKFYADFGTYARTPEGVNVEVLCKGVELEHGAANSNTGNVQAADDTPMTNWIKRLPLVGLTADYLYNPVANFFTNGSLRLLGKLDNVVCNVGGSGYAASDILSDKERLDSLASDCKAGVVDSCASLSLFKDSLFEKYKSCKDETHFIRNNLGDVWNKNFSDMSFVDKVVSLVKAEYNQGRNVFPVYYCSSGGISKEWDYLVWVLFLASAVILFRLFF